MRRALLVVALALLALPAAAPAAPAWLSPFNFPVPASDTSIGGAQGEDQILYQSGGIATEAFLQINSYPPLVTTLHVGVVPPGGAYSEQLTVPTGPGSIPAAVQIAVAPDGAAVAAWIELTGPNPETSPYRFRAAYRPAGSAAWEAPVTIAEDTKRESEINEYVTPAISAGGTAAVGITRLAEGESTGTNKRPNAKIEVALRPAGGSWQAPSRLSPVAISASNLALAFDAAGDLTAAYSQRYVEASSSSGDLYDVIIRRHVAAGGWGVVENITKSIVPWSADAVRLGEDEGGDAVLAYQYFKAPSTLESRAVTRAGPEGSWTTPQTIDKESSAPEAAAVSPTAKAYVLLSHQGTSSAESCEAVERTTVTQPFGSKLCVSPEGEDTFSGSVAFLGSDAYFAWRGNVPGEQANAMIQAVRWQDGASLPGVAQELDTPGLDYGSPTLVPDGQGSVVAFYRGPTQLLRAAAYDGGPPILLGATIPATATAGEPVSLSASFFDLWSGLGAAQPTWSFGDGASSAGAAVTHTFAAPGTYTITLQAADALGNSTSSQYTIAVGAGPALGPPPPSLVLPPRVTISLPACGRRLSKKACARLRSSIGAWQTLRGTVLAPAGMRLVQVDVSRASGSRYEVLAGGRFRRTTKARARATFVRAKVTGTVWTLRLPKLRPGRYTIVVQATDEAGRRSAAVSRTLLLR